MKRSIIIMILVLVGSLLIVGLASAKASAEVNMTLSDFKIEMPNSTLPANTPITFTVTNKGAVAHEVVFERAGAMDEPLEINGKEAELEAIKPGETRSVVWTLPEAGQYQFGCHVPGHFEAGMKTTFTVAAPEAAAAAAPAPAAAPAATSQLPRTAGSENWWVPALGLLALAVLGAGLVLRKRRA
jgi:LPXTG-motif cell wall-anchored protein